MGAGGGGLANPTPAGFTGLDLFGVSFNENVEFI